MRSLDRRAERTLEILLVLITLALACVLYAIERSQAVVLNLFFLPVVLAAFFLGTYRAGVLALFAVIAASSVIMCDLAGFSFVQSPVSIALSMIVWGAVLGLTAILVGTLSEERTQRSAAADEAQLGLIEVLAGCLRGGEVQARSRRLQRLAGEVARRMQLDPADMDALRRAAVLQELEHAMHHHPLVRDAVQRLQARLPEAAGEGSSQTSRARGILHAVRQYLDLQLDRSDCLTPDEALTRLRDELPQGELDPGVLFVLEEAVRCQVGEAVGPAGDLESAAESAFC
jgi:K+-sensing histidine kinase KdpD